MVVWVTMFWVFWGYIYCMYNYMDVWVDVRMYTINNLYMHMFIPKNPTRVGGGRLEGVRHELAEQGDGALLHLLMILCVYICGVSVWGGLWLVVGCACTYISMCMCLQKP